MAAADRHEPAVVVTGPEPLLVRRAAEEALAAIRASHADRSVVVVDCAKRPESGSVAMDLAQAAAPSLFGDTPVLFVRDVEAGDEATVTVVKALLADREGAPVVVTHNGSAKGRGVVTAATKAGVRVVKVSRPGDRDVRKLARDEARHAGGQLTDAAEQWLVDALGTESLELLLAAVRQAVSDSEDHLVDEAAVQVMFPHQAKVSSFRVVDHIWAGRTTEALRLLRTMEQRERGVGVSVVAAIAHGLRMMAVAGLRGAAPPPDLAVAPWQADRARDNVRRWHATPGRIAEVAAQLPTWDADMKGGLDGGTAFDDEQKMAMLELITARLAKRPNR